MAVVQICEHDIKQDCAKRVLKAQPTVLHTEGLGQCLPKHAVLTVCVSGDIKQRTLGSGRELQASLPL